MPNADVSFGEDVFNRFMQYFNDEVMVDFYKDMCYCWLEKNINDNNTDHIDTKNIAYRNVEIEGITFDFACRKDRNVYAYFDTLPGKGLSASLWQEIDTVTSKTTPFYKNEYYICTVNRVPDSLWKVSKT